jgi:hypothetical protein
MRKMIYAAALVIAIGAAGVKVAAEQAAPEVASAAESLAVVASHSTCTGTSAQVAVPDRGSDSALMPGVTLPDEPNAQPTGGGSWPDCAPIISCGPHPCHPSTSGCQILDTGVQFCGWDGSINPPEFACPKNQTIHVKSCPCLPAESLCASSNQTLVCL